jgi:FtsP/CotA-like multicopper oxidase with cupredoxin domain
VHLQNPRAGRRAAKLILAPGERCDLIVDFSGYAGQTLTLTNSAMTPFPVGVAVNPRTTGLVMQFRVGRALRNTAPDASLNPATQGTMLRVTRIERPMVPMAAARLFTLNEDMGPLGPLAMYVNNTMYHHMSTENLAVGATEMWEIVNLTVDTHPIHLHLLQFQIVDRQAVDLVGYQNVYGMPMPGMGPPMDPMVATPATGMKLGGNPDVTPYLLGAPLTPDLNERGWKDTFRMNPGEVTRVLVRVAPQDGEARAGGVVMPGMNLFAFDPTAPLGTTDAFGYPGGPGYVWHCHIVDHEDNDMMRPMTIVPGSGPVMTPSTRPTVATITSVSLSRSEPNPARGFARVSFAIPDRRHVDLVVYDLSGRAVATLASGEFAPGSHSVEWTGRDGAGRVVPEGTYWYRLRAGDDVRTQRMVWLH